MPSCVSNRMPINADQTRNDPKLRASYIFLITLLGTIIDTLIRVLMATTAAPAATSRVHFERKGIALSEFSSILVPSELANFQDLPPKQISTRKQQFAWRSCHNSGSFWSFIKIIFIYKYNILCRIIVLQLEDVGDELLRVESFVFADLRHSAKLLDAFTYFAWAHFFSEILKRRKFGRSFACAKYL